MGVVYLITSHRAPRQVERLATVLRDESPAGRVLIHHDPSGTPLPSTLFDDRVTAVPDPLEVRWGDWSQVRTIVHALRAALALDPDWIVLISGQDYPVSPVPAIEADLDAREADALLDHRPTLAAGAEAKLRYLSRTRVLPSTPLTRRVPAFVRGVTRHACWRASSRFTGFWVRPVPQMGRVLVGHRTRGLPLPADRFFGGSDWFSLRATAARTVVAETDAGGPLVEHFRPTLLPSEAYFATLLCNRPELRIDGDFRRWIRWGRPSAHPLTVTAGDVDVAAAAGAHFARKFDLDAEPDALDAADRARGR